MRVMVNKQFSAWAPVISAVPQGSVLGPLLFLIYVNDLPDGIKNDMRMFADNTKIWSRIGGLTDCVQLQADLNQLHAWSDKWLLSFNPDKCKVMHVGHDYRFLYTIQKNNSTHNLSATTEERDLGIVVTDNLEVSTQCTEAAKRAMKVLRMIRRQFKDMDKECFTILYKSFVKPHMEFAIQVWSPYLKRDIESLQRAQRRATKLVKEFLKLSYEDRFCKLVDRRLRGDLIETYKVVTAKEKVRKEDFFIFSDTGYNLRGHCYKLATTRNRLEVHRNFFSQRVVGRPWNLLPAHIVEAPTVNAFKNRYDSMKSGPWGTIKLMLLRPTSTSTSTSKLNLCNAF